MGQCTLVVRVTGAHHNGKSSDIDQLSAKFVKELGENGHSVSSAYLSNGSENDILNYPVMPLKSNT